MYLLNYPLHQMRIATRSIHRYGKAIERCCHQQRIVVLQQVGKHILQHSICFLFCGLLRLSIRGNVGDHYLWQLFLNLLWTIVWAQAGSLWEHHDSECVKTESTKMSDAANVLTRCDWSRVDDMSIMWCSIEVLIYKFYSCVLRLLQVLFVCFASLILHPCQGGIHLI